MDVEHSFAFNIDLQHGDMFYILLNFKYYYSSMVVYEMGSDDCPAVDIYTALICF